MGIPINQQNIQLMEMFKTHVEQKLKASVVEIQSRQKKELMEHIANLDITEYIEQAFLELSHSDEAKEVFKGATIDAVKFMLDVNGASTLEETVKL